MAIMFAGSAALITVSGSLSAHAQDKKNMSHVHMGHVMTSWKDTPDIQGLYTTAKAEAEIALQHAGLAMQKPDNLEWLQLHIGHVLHAVDPTVEPQGPGLGYGVVKAANGVAQHINFAAESEGASKNVQTHSVHVATSAENTVDWAKQIVELGKEVRAAQSATEAAAKVGQIQVLTKQLIDGVDANGDGKVTWVQDEGGLGQVELHMGFMAKGEGQS
jgi:hypothetical protein